MSPVRRLLQPGEAHAVEDSVGYGKEVAAGATLGASVTFEYTCALQSAEIIEIPATAIATMKSGLVLDIDFTPIQILMISSD